MTRRPGDDPRASRREHPFDRGAARRRRGGHDRRRAGAREHDHDGAAGAAPRGDRADRGRRVDRRGGPDERQTARVRRRHQRVSSDVDQVLHRRRAPRDGAEPRSSEARGAPQAGGRRGSRAGASAAGSSSRWRATRSWRATIPETRLALPEVHVGVMGAGNGALRVANRAGLRVAIDLAVGGEPLRASAARSLDLVDDVCPRAILLDAAARHAKALVGHVPRVRDERGDLRTFALEKNPHRAPPPLQAGARTARARRTSTTRAPALVVDVLERFAEKGCGRSGQARGQVVRRARRERDGAPAHRAVAGHGGARPQLGGGREGRAAPDPPDRGARRRARWAASIAYATAAAGISVRLKEKDDGAIGRALRGVKTRLVERVERGELTALEAEQVFARLSATTDFSGLRNADAVIEAVPEDLALKQEVLREVEPLIGPRCVYASNASSIPIARIAQVAVGPRARAGHALRQPVRRRCRCSRSYAPRRRRRGRSRPPWRSASAREERSSSSRTGPASTRRGSSRRS